METYTLELCGLKRELPLAFVGRTTQLASFSLLGDAELTTKIAEKLHKILKQVQDDNGECIIVGPEVKVVPLLQELAGKLGHKKYIVCRKSVKPGMLNPIILKPLPHFPKHVKQLVLDGQDAKLLNGKKVVIIDDVISTGVTMRMMAHLMKKIGAEVVLMAAVLKQGEQFDKFDNLLTLAELPVFKVE
ncbi:MAG: phosphoribosyltransferase family protein [Patescibacteria group bacterium]